MKKTKLELSLQDSSSWAIMAHLYKRHEKIILYTLLAVTYTWMIVHKAGL